MNRLTPNPACEVLANYIESFREKYEPSHFANPVGTYMTGHVESSFTEMLDLFGCPLRVNSGVEVNEWRFIGPKEKTFTIADAAIPSDKINGPAIFFLGATSARSGIEFGNWLNDKLKAYRAVRAAKWVA